VAPSDAQYDASSLPSDEAGAGQKRFALGTAPRPIATVVAIDNLETGASRNVPSMALLHRAALRATRLVSHCLALTAGEAHIGQPRMTSLQCESKIQNPNPLSQYEPCASQWEPQINNSKWQHNLADLDVCTPLYVCTLSTAAGLFPAYC
jgi:hypothetical protein